MFVVDELLDLTTQQSGYADDKFICGKVVVRAKSYKCSNLASSSRERPFNPILFSRKVTQVLN